MKLSLEEPMVARDALLQRLPDRLFPVHLSELHRVLIQKTGGRHGTPIQATVTRRIAPTKGARLVSFSARQG